MKITLIEPAMIKTPGFSEKPSFCLPPLSLPVLAGLTPDDCELEAIDDRLETIDYDQPRDLVGISVKTFTARRSYQIADQFRSRGVPVVLGGFHPTLVPQEAQAHADAVVVGEAEEVWSAVVRDARTGRLAPVYPSPGPAARFDQKVRPGVLAGKKYLPVTMIEAGRGCLHACNFCSVTTFFGRAHRLRPVSEILGELESREHRTVFFVDDNIVANPSAAKALFTALRPLGIRWVGQASLAMAADPELLDLMRASGCMGVLLGIESVDPDNLAQINKGWNTLGRGYADALAAIHDRGIAVLGSFVLGMDHDTPAALDGLLEFAIRQRLFAVMFNLLTPYPGTPLYSELAAKGRLRMPEWWRDPAYRYGDVVFEPAKISAEELAQKRLQMYREFYSASSMLARGRNWRANASGPSRLLTFLALNRGGYTQEAARAGLALGETADEPVLSDPI